MKPTEVLKEEHRVIESVLDCLEAMARQAASEKRLDGQSATETVAFFREFADRCHHAKEEAHLFPWMESRGFPRDGGPTGVMIHEHEQGRAHVRALAEAIDGAAAGDESALRSFAEHAAGYVALLREHIQKEDHCLFAMADQAARGPDDERALMDTFEKAEREEVGAGAHERWIAVARQLTERFGLPAPPECHHTEHGGHHTDHGHGAHPGAQHTG